MQTQPYYNPTDEVIRFEIGTAPGSPTQKYTLGPGEGCLGPVAYEKAFKRYGLAVGEGKKAEEAPPQPVDPTKELSKRPKAELIEMANALDIEGRSEMTKKELVAAICEVI